MKIFNLKHFVMALMAITLFTACSDDEEDDDADPVPTPITVGSDVTVRNTYEDVSTPEIAFATALGMSEDALDLSASVSNETVEFEDVLYADVTSTFGFVINGLYDIDITDNSISFEVLPDTSDMFWASNFRTIEAGTYDRYYLTFGSDQNVTSASTTRAGVNLRIDDASTLVVEISEGYVFEAGGAFTIDLE